MKAKPKLIAFTDGACSGNPGPGGWGALLVSPLGKIRELGGAAGATTNNRMELTAAIEALRALCAVKRLSAEMLFLYTDSKYVIQGITEWIDNWRRRGWQTAAGKPVLNQDLWQALSEQLEAAPFRVEWSYVPGHEGVPGNERCDEIAVAFSKGLNPPLFVGDAEKYGIPFDALQQNSSVSVTSGGEKRSPIYLSLVHGKLHRDASWKSCEARVKGVAGARFKKVETAADEERVLRSWGLK